MYDVFNVSTLGFDVYDPNTHYLVEKEDYKIKRLKESIASSKERIKDIDSFILDLSKTKSELIVKLTDLEKELSKIEK